MFTVTVAIFIGLLIGAIWLTLDWYILLDFYLREGILPFRPRRREGR